MGGGVYDALVVVLDAADELVVGLEDGIKDCVIWIQIIVLIQVVDMYVVTKFNLTRVREFDTKYYIDEGCFPGTVFAKKKINTVLWLQDQGLIVSEIMQLYLLDFHAETRARTQTL